MGENRCVYTYTTAQYTQYREKQKIRESEKERERQKNKYSTNNKEQIKKYKRG